MEDHDEFGDVYASVGPSFSHKPSLQNEQLLSDDETDADEELEICSDTNNNANATVHQGSPNANDADVGGEVENANGEEEWNTDDDTDSDDLNILVNQDEGDDESMIGTDRGFDAQGIRDLESPPSVKDHHHRSSHYSRPKYLRPDVVAAHGACSGSTDVDQSHSKPSVLNGVGGQCGRGGSVVEIGDWSVCTGRHKLQRNFHSGIGVLPWNGRNMSQKRNRFEFTLPSSKYIFDIDVDKFEEKHWRQPGVDVTDFFNFDLNEDSWKSYCRKLEQFQLEATMQSKISVYESGQYKERHDPDLPSELLAVSGLHESSRESIQKKNDIKSVAVTNIGKSSARGHFVPTGRTIQVDGGLGGRLPSVDVRRPRLRDSDVVIQIVAHDKTEDDSIAPADGPGIADDISQKEKSGKVHNNEIEGNLGCFSPGYLLQESQSLYKSKSEIPPVKIYSQRGTAQRPLHDGEGILPSPIEPSVPHQQISKSEPGMCPIKIHGLPHTARHLTTYKSHLYFKDEKSNQNAVNQRGPTVADNHYVKNGVIRKSHLVIGSTIDRENKSHLYFKDEKGNQNAVNQRGPTVADNHYMKNGVLRKLHPVIGSTIDREKNSKDEIHFDRISHNFDRQSSELRIQADGKGINGFVHSIRRQKLNIQNELPEVLAADDNYLLNMIRSDTSKFASENSRDSSKDQGDAEQQGCGCSQQKWSCSSAERIVLQSEEKNHLWPRKEYCWNGECEAVKDRIRLKYGDISNYIRSKEDAYSDRYEEETCYNECKEESYDNHRERVVHANHWQPRAECEHILKGKYEDETRDRLDIMEKLKYRPKEQDTKRQSREEHLLGRKREVDDARNDYCRRQEAMMHRGMEGCIAGQLGKEKVLYQRKNKQEDMNRINQADNDEGIKHQIDCNNICRNKREWNDDHLRRKEVESWKRDASGDTRKLKQINDVWKQMQREDEYWRKSGHKKLSYKRDRDQRCWPSGRSRYKEDKLWHGYYRGDSHFQEETRLLSIHKFKLYKKRWHQEYGKIRALIDEDGKSRYHERDGICPGEDHYTYERSSRHEEIHICYDISDGCQYGEECNFFREKYKLDTTKKEFHATDRHGSTSGQADNLLRKDLTNNGERRKPEDFSIVHRGEKVYMGVMEIQETDRRWNSHRNHQTQNQERVLDILKRTRQQSDVCLDFVQLKKDAHNICHPDNDRVRNRYSKFDSWEHHKGNMRDLDSSMKVKELSNSKEDIIKMEEDAKKVQTNLKEIEIKSVKDKQHLTEGHVVDDDKQVVREEIVNASDGKNIGKVHQHHLNMLAKMEKRIERFKQPINTEKPINKNAQYETTLQMEVVEVKQERPARKRRWGSG